MRLMQHKREAYWFYRYLSIFYDDLVNPLFWTERMRDASLEIAGLDEGEGLSVVDVGSGTGFTTEGIVRYVAPEQVTCFDQSPHQMAHARAKRTLAGAAFHLGDAEDLPANTNAFDRYVSAGSIEYWPHPGQGVREAYRVVKPGGRATVVGPLRPPTWWGRLIADTWMLFPSDAEYRDLFARAGFEDIRVRYTDPGWYTGDEHFAISISGRKPLDGPDEAPPIPEPVDTEAHGPVAAAKTIARVLAGSAAGGAFIPMALGAKAVAAVAGRDDGSEPLTRAQRSVLVGVGVAAAVGLATWIGREPRDGARDDGATADRARGDASQRPGS